MPNRPVAEPVFNTAPAGCLDTSSALALLIASANEPLTVELEDPRSPLASLPEKERHWLVDSGFRLLAPILSRDGSLLGLIGLGEKKSGLPFFREDRQLLHAVASSAAWVLELDQGRALPPHKPFWRGIPREIRGPTKGKTKRSIQTPPGLRLLALAEFLFSHRTFKMVLEPTLRHLYDEYCEALNARRPRKAAWVRIRGYWSFWSAVMAQLPISLLKRAFELWKASW